MTDLEIIKEQLNKMNLKNVDIQYYDDYIDNLEMFDKQLKLNRFWVECDSETGKDCKHCSFLVCENNESVGHEEWCNSEHDHMRRLKKAPSNYQYVWVEENADRKD